MSITVVFIDAVGFTVQGEKTPPDLLVASLDILFGQFDSLADQLGLEKIKTVGEAYIAVAGAPKPMVDHAAAAAKMALVVLEKLEGRTWPSGDPIQVRIGLASGPAVAGVIGQQNFAYDLWGTRWTLPTGWKRRPSQGGSWPRRGRGGEPRRTVRVQPFTST